MKKVHIKILVVPCLFLMLAGFSTSGEEKTNKAQRPLDEIQDILAWKSIRSSTISNNGQWFAFRLSPQEGDGKVVIKETKGDKEYTFSGGEAQGYSQNVVFSEDSKWVAFTIFPDRTEAKKLKQQKKKLYNTVALVYLDSGEKQEYKKINRCVFSGEESSWIALHRYPAEVRNGSGGQNGDEDKWRGADLILHELKTGRELNIGNVAEFAFDKKGLWLAWIVDAQEKSGNGIQARNMKTGVLLPLDSGEAVYKKLTWTETGNGLAALKGLDHEDYEDKLYSLVGFSQFNTDVPTKLIFDPKSDEDFPAGMTISPNRNPLWTDDLSAILFGIHELKANEKKEESDPAKNKVKGEEPGEDKESKEKPSQDIAKKKNEIDKEDLPGLVIWHWQDKRLQSMQQVQEQRDKNFSYLCTYRVKEKKFIRIADDNIRQVTPAPKQRWAIGVDNSAYELLGNLEGRRYGDVYVFNLTTGEKKLALKKNRWYFGPSPNGTHFLYYDEGHFHTFEMSTGKTFNITKDVPTSFINTENDQNVVDPPIYSYSFGWVKDGASLLLYDNWDVWNVPVHGGPGVNLTVSGKQDGIRYRSRYRFDPEEKGIDLSKPLYISTYGEWTKKGGVALVEKGKPGAKMLLWDDAVFSLSKAEKADAFLFTKQTSKDYPDFYATDGSLQKGRKLTEANPQQKEFLWSDGGILIDYKSAKGDRLQAALFLPANYEEGKKYPAIVYIYEKVSQGLNRYYSPSARGFNKSVYTSRGYAVLMPDIVYKIDDPGMSSVWCVLPAVEAAVDSGVVDKDRVGIHGHSWGGYQTSFLITQTDAFAAAAAGAPLTNMISMYSSIYWNSGSANQPIFESSQGRFKGGYWENIEAYTRNSPVYFARNVNTPLLLLHNDKDGAVDWNQGIEYFNTLRRLEKPVVLLQYKGENHGLRKPPNLKDYFIRMREFFDHYLMGLPAPEWLKQGVSHLDHEEHIKERTKKILKPDNKKK